MADPASAYRKYPYHVNKKDLAKSYEVRLAAQFGDAKAKSKLQAYKRRAKERKMEASKTEWSVDGRVFNRYRMMDYIVTRVSNGESLPQVCEKEEMPSMLQVYQWFNNHPDFEKAYKQAEEVRGHLLGEQALLVAMDTDRENVAADKLKFEALSKAAARTNLRFQDKQVQVQQDEYGAMTADQIRQRIGRMLEADPSLLSSLGSGHDSLSMRPSSEGMLELLPEPELPMQDPVETQTHDEVGS